VIDTHVDGDVSAVRTGATWLRDTLKKNLGDAADDAVAARRQSTRDWEGRDQAAYHDFTGTLAKAMDDHKARAGRAAQAYDDYAGRLHRIQHRMGQLRDNARDGGLVVAGETIQQPPDAVAVPDLPAGSTPEESQAHHDKMKVHDAQVAKIDLYQQLADDVTNAWDDFQDYCDSDLTAAQKDAEEGDDIDALRTFVEKNGLNVIAGASVAFFDGSLERRAEEYVARADELRRARRSGNPARRARGRAPDAGERIRGWRNAARGMARWAKVLGVVGVAVDVGFGVWDVAHGGSPGRATVTTAASIAGGALAVAGVVAVAGLLTVSAPVWVTAAAAAGAAALVGYGAGKAWDALPDSFTDGVDDAMSDAWDGATDAVGDGWHAVTGWL
jgi:hypothetical protein